MKTALAMMAALLLSGCGTREPELNQQFSGDDDLKTEAIVYLQECQNAKAGCHIYSLSIDWVESLPENTVGLCEVSFEGGRLVQKISIHRSMVGNEALSQVIYHEVNHCTRFQEHAADNAVALMRPTYLNPEDMAGKTVTDLVRESFQVDVKFQGYESF